MLAFFGLIVDFFAGLVVQLDSVTLFAGVSFWDIILGFIITGFITTVFWKGART